MGHKLLFVDDEENILKSLMRLFHDEDYEIFTALSGEEGLKVVEENDISLVLSDHMMPGIKGADFLARVKDLTPDTVRILFTGYADLEAAIAAINKGEVYRFITKPWNDDELLITVKQSLDYRDLILKNTNLTNTVRKQAFVLKKLEEASPGISRVERTEDGAVIIDIDDDEITI